MKDKKGIMFLSKKVINLLITVIVIGFLIYLGAKTYAALKEDNDVEKAQGQLDKISVVIDMVRESGKQKLVDVYPPAEWHLVSFPNYDFPYSAECRTSKGCLCFCEDASCSENKKKKCQGYKFDVQVDKSNGVLKLEEIEDLVVFEEEMIVKIKRA